MKIDVKYYHSKTFLLEGKKKWKNFNFLKIVVGAFCFNRFASLMDALIESLSKFIAHNEESAVALSQSLVHFNNNPDTCQYIVLRLDIAELLNFDGTILRAKIFSPFDFRRAGPLRCMSVGPSKSVSTDTSMHAWLDSTIHCAAKFFRSVPTFGASVCVLQLLWELFGSVPSRQQRREQQIPSLHLDWRCARRFWHFSTNVKKQNLFSANFLFRSLLAVYNVSLSARWRAVSIERNWLCTSCLTSRRCSASAETRWKKLNRNDWQRRTEALIWCQNKQKGEMECLNTKDDENSNNILAKFLIMFFFCFSIGRILRCHVSSHCEISVEQPLRVLCVTFREQWWAVG